MLTYPATLTPGGDGYLVRFPDIPEALTPGSMREAALDMAADALRTVMDFYFENGRCVPMPSRVKRGQTGMELPPSVVAKILLLNAMLERRVTAAAASKQKRKTSSVWEGLFVGLRCKSRPHCQIPGSYDIVTGIRTDYLYWGRLVDGEHWPW